MTFVLALAELGRIYYEITPIADNHFINIDIRSVSLTATYLFIADQTMPSSLLRMPLGSRYELPFRAVSRREHSSLPPIFEVCYKRYHLKGLLNNPSIFSLIIFY